MADTPQTQQLQKKYVLIAEDDPAYGSVYQAKLENEGYEVAVVENGDMVLARMRERAPDLLILDLVMADKTGFEVLEELRNDMLLKDTKVIVASNLSQAVDRERVQKFNIVDYFVKSNVSIAEMVGKIKKALQQ